MSNIDEQTLTELRRLANAAEPEVWLGIEDDLSSDGYDRRISRFIQHCSPGTVLALLDELEAKEECDAIQFDHINQQADRIESLEEKNSELGKALEAAEKRITELERDLKAAENNLIDANCHRAELETKK